MVMVGGNLLTMLMCLVRRIDVVEFRRRGLNLNDDTGIGVKSRLRQGKIIRGLIQGRVWAAKFTNLGKNSDTDLCRKLVLYLCSMAQAVLLPPKCTGAKSVIIVRATQKALYSEPRLATAFMINSNRRAVHVQKSPYVSRQHQSPISHRLLNRHI
jgi:hypothetical protein